MHKIFALTLNELIKIFIKKSTAVLLIVMIAAIFAAGGIIKAAKGLKTASSAQDSSSKWQMEEMNDKIITLKNRLSNIQKSIDTSSGNKLISLNQQKKTIQNQIDMLQYGIDHKIYASSKSYCAEALQKLFSYKLEMSQLSDLKLQTITDTQKQMLDTDKIYINRLTKIIENKDFKDYIAFSNEIIEKDNQIPDGEKKIMLESNALRLKLGLTYENGSLLLSENASESTIALIEKEKRSLLYNVDYTGQFGNNVMLTENMRTKIQNNIAVNIYKLEHKLITDTGKSDSSASPMNTEYSAGGFIITILVIILAGSSFSNEFTSGSIKSLIIAPVNRWKIITAKLMAIIIVLASSGVLLYVFSILANGSFFGFNSDAPYIYASGGIAHAVNFYLFYFLKMFVLLIPMLAYILLSLMLSVLTHNTAAAVGISMAVYFVGSIGNSFLQTFAKGEWLKFIPFNNLNYFSRLFSFENISAASQSSGNSASLTFSICYMLSLFLCMGLSMYDAFCRRDIK